MLDIYVGMRPQGIWDKAVPIVLEKHGNAFNPASRIGDNFPVNDPSQGVRPIQDLERKPRISFLRGLYGCIQGKL